MVMRTIINKGIAVTLMTLALGTAYSQIKISAEIRPRMEYRHGFKSLATTDMDNAIFIDQRSRLNFDYKQNRIQTKIVLQDVRTWGSQSQLVNNEDFGASIHEAWGLVKLNDNWGFKFGRQELVYDDHRILGNVGWAQQARSHDAAIMQYRKNKLKIDFGGAYNQNKPQLNTTNYTVAKSYKTMQYVWGNYKTDVGITASALLLGVGQQVNFINQQGNNDFQDNYTLTAGTFIKYKKEKFGAFLSAYYQMGSSSTWPAVDVAAHDLSAGVSYQINDPFKVSAGFEILSGNDEVNGNTTQNAFNPYFGTNHKFNGVMDYFYVGNHIGSVGLNDIWLRVDYKHKKFTVGAAGHMFMANGSVLNDDKLASDGVAEAMNSNLGTEIDVFGGFKLVPGAMCKFGYSQMFGTDSMVALRGGGDINEISNWGYVMIILKPTLFEQK